MENRDLEKYKKFEYIGNKIVNKNNLNVYYHQLFVLRDVVFRLWQSRILEENILEYKNDEFEKILPVDLLLEKSIREVSSFEKTYKVADLSKDFVLTRVWDNTTRFLSALTSLQKYSFRQDDNHQIIYYKYLDAFECESGNHSITAAMLMKQGLVSATHQIDCSFIFQHVDTDGINFFIRGNENDVICKVKCWEQAIVFKLSSAAYLMGYRLPEDNCPYDKSNNDI